MDYLDKIHQIRCEYYEKTAMEPKYVCMNYNTYCSVSGWLILKQFQGYVGATERLHCILGMKVLVDYSNTIPDDFMYVLSEVDKR